MGNYMFKNTHGTGLTNRHKKEKRTKKERIERDLKKGVVFCSSPEKIEPIFDEEKKVIGMKVHESVFGLDMSKFEKAIKETADKEEFWKGSESNLFVGVFKGFGMLYKGEKEGEYIRASDGTTISEKVLRETMDLNRYWSVSKEKSFSEFIDGFKEKDSKASQEEGQTEAKKKNCGGWMCLAYGCKCYD